MDKLRFPTTADFHIPRSMVGMTISSVPVKEHFRLIRLDIEKYANNNFHLSRLLKIVDRVDETNCLGHMRSMLVLNHMTTYLRIKLLSNDARIVEKVAVLIDTLVKNCHYRMHLLIGNRLFMKTFGIVIRQLLIDQRPTYHRVGQRMLDILQGWGEAFSQGERCIIYPHIVDTYQKMQFKYGISYQRAHYDPLRVPIHFGPLHEFEVLQAQGKRFDVKNDTSVTDCHGMQVSFNYDAKIGLIGDVYNKNKTICAELFVPRSPRFHCFGSPNKVNTFQATLSDSHNNQSQLMEDVKSHLVQRLQEEENNLFMEELPNAAMQENLNLKQKIINCEEIDENVIKISAYDTTKASITGKLVRRQELLSASECSTSASSIEEMIHGKLDDFNILENDGLDDFATSASSISSASYSDKDNVAMDVNGQNMDDSNILHYAPNNIDTLYSCSAPILSPYKEYITRIQVDKISYHGALSPVYERKFVPSCSSQPSSDPDLEVKYFGHQRVLVRKTKK